MSGDPDQTPDQQAIAVRCVPDGTDGRCMVTVGVDAGSTRHHVTVRADDLNRLGPGIPVDELVRASFGFLLEREPRESILSAFEIPLIGRYFPEYEMEIRNRLGGAASH